MNQNEMAAGLRMALRTYQNYERGEREFPVELMEPIMLGMGVNPVWLINGTGEPFIDEAHTPIHLKHGGHPVLEAAPDYATMLKQDIRNARTRVRVLLDEYGLQDAWFLEEAMLAFSQVEGIKMDHLMFLARAVRQTLDEHDKGTQDAAQKEGI